MGGYILRGEEKDVVLRPNQVDALLRRGDGDAALLYLCLRRADRGVTPEELTARLGWTAVRLAAAESTLQQLGLIDRPAELPVPEPAEERPVYTASDLAEMLSTDADFRSLVPQTEEKLGKKLKTADLQILAGLYDDLGLPPDVIFLLVSHCVAQAERRYGPGRRPTLRQIEKEGYRWQSMGLMDQEHAARYLKDWADRQENLGRYMQVLHLGDRRPVASEQRYLTSWMEKGFSPEVVALAYDRTVFYKKELNWRYLNGILRRWDENGWHTVEEVEQGDRRRDGKNGNNGEKAGGRDAQIDKYMKW
jgi:DnaD/phage-associated family protein